MIYAATTVSLACLETVVHLASDDLPLNRFLVRIEIPEDVWTARLQRSDSELPIGWFAIPEGKVSLDIGDAWLRMAPTAAKVVPSAIVPEELNVLINPCHRAAATIKALKVRPWFYDARLG